MKALVRLIGCVLFAVFLFSCNRDGASPSSGVSVADQPGPTEPPPPEPVRLQVQGRLWRGRVIAKEHDPDPPRLSSSGRHYVVTIEVEGPQKVGDDGRWGLLAFSKGKCPDLVRRGQRLTLPHCEFGTETVAIGDAFFFRSAIEGQFGKPPWWYGPSETFDAGGASHQAEE